MYKAKIKLVFMGIRIPEWVRSAIHAAAQAHGLTDSEIVRQILEKHFLENTKPKVEPQPQEEPIDYCI